MLLTREFSYWNKKIVGLGSNCNLKYLIVICFTRLWHIELAYQASLPTFVKPRWRSRRTMVVILQGVVSGGSWRNDH